MARIVGHLEWDDDSLRPGQKKEGGLHSTLFDGEGHLKGHARFMPGVDDDEGDDESYDDDDEGDDDTSLGSAIAGLALVGLTLTAAGVAASVVADRADERAAKRKDRAADRELEREQWAAERADRAAQRWERRRDLEWKRAESRRAAQQAQALAGWYDDGQGGLRWWNGYQWTEHCLADPTQTSSAAGWYDDGSGLPRWWDGQRWTEHFRSPAPAQATAAAGAASSSVETGLVPAQPSILMSSAEWRERMRLMLIARAISEEQWVMLANASIEDADQSLVDWQAELRRLTPQQFSALINRELETNPTLRQEAQAVESNWRSGNPAAQPAIGRTIRRSPSPGGGADTTGNCTSTPAGWFNDGSGRLRWWDGHQWTDRWG